MSTIVFRISLIIFLLSACATTGRQPDWVTGKSDDYPQSQYLMATGSAANPEDAKTRALSNLAGIFEVRVEETSRDESSAWQQNGPAGEARQGTRQLTVRYIDAYTTKMLEGADVVENWYDSAQHQYYALAVISRLQLGTRLRADIAKADRYVRQRLTNAELLKDPFARARMIYSAGSALRTREMLQKDLQIIDLSGAGVPANWSSDLLRTRIDAALSRVKVRESAQEGAPLEWQPLLRAAITAAGMQHSSEAAEYELQGVLDIQDVGWKDGWYWYRGSMQVSLVKLADGKISASAQWPLKSSGQSQQQSQIRLHDEIAEVLNRELRPALLSGGVEQND